MKGCGIYLYKDKHSKLPLYVGKSKHLKRRHSQHINCSKKEWSIPFEKEAIKRGWENIEYIILEDNLEEHQLPMKEREWFIKLRPLYNVRFPRYSPEDIASFKIQYEASLMEEECLAAIKN